MKARLDPFFVGRLSLQLVKSDALCSAWKTVAWFMFGRRPL